MRPSPALLICLLLALPATAGGGEPDGPRSLADFEARGTATVEATVQEDAPLVVLRDAHVMTATGATWERGWLVLEGGSIRDLGEGEPPTVAGATVLSLEGHWVTPGLIDPHSHIGVYAWPSATAHDDGNEWTAATTPGVWAEHSLKPADIAFQSAVEGGVTTILATPGSANLVGGRAVVLSMVPHRGGRAMRFPGAPGSVKLACGENPKKTHGSKGGPSTRMGNLRGLRQAFHRAEKARRDWDRWEEKAAGGGGKKKGKGGGEPPDPPDRDLDMETLVGILRGELLPQVHCYQSDDMLSMLQVADEFGFRIRAFHHATSAYKVRDILAERQVGAITWSDWWGFKVEAWDGVPANAALVHEAGGRAILHSDSPTTIQYMNQEAAKAYREGLRAGVELSEDDALRWVTINPAWALGIDDVTGSLERGKRADVVVWDGHPFSVYTKARLVFIAGVLRHDVDQPRTWSDFELGREVVR
jgi:imidazolonepropionase-like amidohydrolase